MRIDFKFRNADHSSELCDLATEKVDKVVKHIPQVGEVTVAFETEGRDRCVEIHVYCFETSFVAKGRSNNFQGALDSAVHKIGRQMRKKKNKVQNHRQSEPAHERMNEPMAEFDGLQDPFERAS